MNSAPPKWAQVILWVFIVGLCALAFRLCSMIPTATDQKNPNSESKPKVPVSPPTVKATATTLKPGTVEWAKREDRFTLLPGGNRALVHVPRVGDVEGQVIRNYPIRNSRYSPPSPDELGNQVYRDPEFFYYNLAIVDDEGNLIYLRKSEPTVRWDFDWDAYESEMRTKHDDSFKVLGLAKFKMSDAKLHVFIGSGNSSWENEEWYALRLSRKIDTLEQVKVYDADCLINITASHGKRGATIKLNTYPDPLGTPEIGFGFYEFFRARWAKAPDGAEWWLPNNDAPSRLPVPGTPAVQIAEEAKRQLEREQAERLKQQSPE
jgi:hypothetical protein